MLKKRCLVVKNAEFLFPTCNLGGSVGSGSWYQERGGAGGGVAPEPYFQLEGVALNVTAVEGRRAELECGVGNLRDRRVSWIRKERHPVVLSSGTVVFTSDSRVSSCSTVYYKTRS